MSSSAPSVPGVHKVDSISAAVTFVEECFSRFRSLEYLEVETGKRSWNKSWWRRSPEGLVKAVSSEEGLSAREYFEWKGVWEDA